MCWFGHCQMLAHFLFNQLGYFSFMRKSLSFNILFRVDQPAITLNIEDTPTAFDQFNIWIRIIFLQFALHPGSLRKKVSSNSICKKNVHTPSSVLTSQNGYMHSTWQPFSFAKHRPASAPFCHRKLKKAHHLFIRQLGLVISNDHEFSTALQRTFSHFWFRKEFLPFYNSQKLLFRHDT